MISSLDSQPQDRPSTRGRRRVTAHVTLTRLLVTALAAALAASGATGPWLLLIAVVLAHRLSDRRHSVLANLPVALLASATMLVVVLHLLGELGASVLASTTSSRGLLVLLTVAAVPWLVRRGASGPAPFAYRGELVACAPAMVVLGLSVWLHRQDLPHAVGALLAGWDNGAHLLMSAALTRTGDLSYDVDVYPRGLHALVALTVSTAGSSDATPAGLETLLRTHSLLVWFLLVLLTATVALATLRCAALCRLPRRTAVVAAVVAGLATLTPDFFNFTMLYGFQTTLALAVVLAVVTLELLSGRSPARTAALLAMALPATAHVYQLALPVVGVPLLLTAVRLVRSRSLPPRLALAALAAAGVTAWPPAWSVLVNTGPGVVGASGAIGPLPVLLLSLGVLAMAWALTRASDAWVRSLTAMVVALVVLAVMGAWSSGASLAHYYPRKLLWHVALLTLPVTVTACAVLLRTVARRTRGLRVAELASPALAGAGAVIVAVLAVPGPYLAASGAWGLPVGVTRTLLHPEDADRVCDLDSRYARQVGNRLLEFYSDVPVVPPLDAEGLPACSRPPSEP